MKYLLKKWRVIGNLLLTDLKMLFFAPIILFGCNDSSQDELLNRSQEQLDSASAILENNHKIIDERVKMIEELEESWRVRDSVDYGSVSN